MATLVPPAAADVLPVDDLEQYLPDDGDQPDGTFGQPDKPGGKAEKPIPVTVVTTPPKNAAPSGPPGPTRFPGHAFLTDPVAGVYTLVLDPPDGVRGPLALSVEAVGDDAEADPIRLAAARLADGTPLAVPKLGRVGPVPYSGRGPLRAEVTLAVPDRLALRVSGWQEGADAPE